MKSRLSRQPRHLTWLVLVITLALTTVTLVQSARGKIVFTSSRDRDGDDDIYVMNSNGTNVQRLTNHPARDWGPVWSPTGQQIAFVTVRDGNLEIYVMNADGTSQRNLTNFPGHDSHPAWSPDGQKIAFTSKRNGVEDIYVMDADGANQKNLTNHPAESFTCSWSPDGRSIAFASYRDGDSEIYIMDASGKNPRRLTHMPHGCWHPAWSPDGSQIAFIANESGPLAVGPEDYDIYVIDATGENLRDLTKHPAQDLYPSWSPDGRQIVFMSLGRKKANEGNEIYVMTANGTHFRNLTKHPAIDTYPSWLNVTAFAVSPSGKQMTTWGKLKRLTTEASER